MNNDLDKWTSSPVCNRYRPETMRQPNRLEGKVWFDNIVRVRKHFFGDVFLLETHCKGCPGNTQKEACEARCATGYIVTDQCPDVWYDMPCYNAFFKSRQMYMVTVKCENNKRYLATSYGQLHSFIKGYVFNWKGPVTDTMLDYIPDLLELYTKKVVDNQYYRIDEIDVDIHMGIKKNDASAEDALKAATKQWNDILSGLGVYTPIKGLKRHCKKPPVIKGIRQSIPFGRKCETKGCTVGCWDCMRCEWNENRVEEDCDRPKLFFKEKEDCKEKEKEYKSRFLEGRKYYVDCKKEAGQHSKK